MGGIFNLRYRLCKIQHKQAAGPICPVSGGWGWVGGHGYVTGLGWLPTAWETAYLLTGFYNRPIIDSWSAIKRNHINLKELFIMTTKQTTAKTTSNVLTMTDHGKRGFELAGLHLQGLTLSEAMGKVCIAEYKANQKENRTCGTVRSGDEFMVATRNALIDSGKYKLDKAGKCKRLDNLMSDIRKAVNTGMTFEHNNGSDKAKDGKDTASTKRGARQSVGEKSVVKLTIVKDAQAFDVAQGLREAINDTKFRESYGELAAFLTDALNEFQGT